MGLMSACIFVIEDMRITTTTTAAAAAAAVVVVAVVVVVIIISSLKIPYRFNRLYKYRCEHHNKHTGTQPIHMYSLFQKLRNRN